MIKIIVTICLLWVVGPAQAAMQDDVDRLILQIQDAIESGNADGIVQRAGSYVEVSVLGSSTLYSRSQSAYILREFFRQHPPKRFAFQRKMNVGKDWYMYGTYWNSTDRETYRMEIRMRWNGRAYEIKNISITHVGR